MAPTRIYVKSLLPLLQELDIHALSHITGGGLLENIPRVLPDHCKAVIDTQSWTMPPVFKWLQSAGGVTGREMYRTFNCGLGMVIALPSDQRDEALKRLRAAGEQAYSIGHIAAAQEGEPGVELQGAGL